MLKKIAFVGVTGVVGAALAWGHREVEKDQDEIARLESQLRVYKQHAAEGWSEYGRVARQIDESSRQLFRMQNLAWKLYGNYEGSLSAEQEAQIQELALKIREPF